MVIYLAALQGVPKEMYEVAALEGAGPWQRLRYVTIPMISPVILFNVILSLVLSIQYFTQAQVIETPPGSPGNSTMFFVTYYYQQAFTDLHLGYASAMAFLLFILVLHHHRRAAENVVALGVLRERAEVSGHADRIDRRVNRLRRRRRADSRAAARAGRLAGSAPALASTPC